MEEAAAPAVDPGPPGAPGAPLEVPEALHLRPESRPHSQVGKPSETRATPSDQGPSGAGGPPPSPEPLGSFPEGLLPLMVAAGVVDADEEEQRGSSGTEVSAAAAAAATAAAEGGPRLLECLFSPNPAQKLAAADTEDLLLLEQQEVHDLLLRHAVRAEHEDKDTLHLLELLMLQPPQQQQQQQQPLKQQGQEKEQQKGPHQEMTAIPHAAVNEQLVDQLLLPHQQHQQVPVKCLCGLPVEGGIFSCTLSSKRQGAAPSSGGTACCMVHHAFSLYAVSHALFCCCCQGKLRCFLLLERCCSIPAADLLLLQQGRGSLVHAAAMGGSRAIIQRLVTAHGLSPRGAPGKSYTSFESTDTARQQP